MDETTARTAPAGATDDRARRASVFLGTQLAAGGREPVACRVRNLSATGMMIECAVPLQVGEAVDAQLRGVGKVAATVVRQRNGIVGLRFKTPIDPDLCRKPLGSTPPPANPWIAPVDTRTPPVTRVHASRSRIRPPFAG